MELAAAEVQIFVSLVVVLGTAFVALVCDFLKGNNEQLRERNIEMRVRQEERGQFAMADPAQWIDQLAAILKPQVIAAVAAAQPQPQPQREAAPPPAAASPAARREVGVQPSVQPPPVFQPAPAAAAEIVRVKILPIDARAQEREEDAPIAEPEPVQSADALLPSGFQQASVLTRAMESDRTFDGVVVAIGINDYALVKDRVAPGAGTLDASIRAMIQSMLRSQDFACRFTDEEFILVFASESGIAAQRRLYHISERLWDYQLRSLGPATVMFSWGGLEVQNETLGSAVAAARDRMYQSRRSRRTAPVDFSQGRRRVASL